MKNHFFNSENIHSVNFVQGRSGQYRAIVKTKAGIMSTIDDLGILCNWESGARWKSALSVFKSFKKGALQTIEFKADEDSGWLTVFARSGNKVKLMDESMFMTMQVGDINQDWSNTNLYSQANYALAGAKTWASLAFVPNEVEEVLA